MFHNLIYAIQYKATTRKKNYLISQNMHIQIQFLKYVQTHSRKSKRFNFSKSNTNSTKLVVV